MPPTHVLGAEGRKTLRSRNRDCFWAGKGTEPFIYSSFLPPAGCRHLTHTRARVQSWGYTRPGQTGSLPLELPAPTWEVGHRQERRETE